MATSLLAKGRSNKHPSGPENNGDRLPISKVWHKSSPANVAKAAAWDEGSAGWRAWAKHLTKRKRPAPLSALLKDAAVPVLWAMPPEVLERQGALARRLAKLDTAKSGGSKRFAEMLAEWLAEPPASTSDPGLAIECLAWAYALPRLADRVPADSWWALLQRLLDVSGEAVAVGERGDVFSWQSLGGELPLALAYLLPELKPCRKMLKVGRRTLSDGLDRLLDGEGLPHRKHLPLLRPLAACWTRARAIGERIDGGCFNEAAEIQYDWLARAVLRLTRPDGSQVLAAPDGPPLSADALAALLRFGGDATDRRIASLVAPRLCGGKPKGSRTASLPDAAVHSEWSEVAQLRTTWRPQSPAFTVDYGGSEYRSEMSRGDALLWTGTRETVIHFNGKPLVATDGWEEICWFSDEDVDYLELELSLSEQVKIQRQLLLAHAGRFVFVADAVLAKRPGLLEYHTTWPLAKGMEFKPNAETSEGVIEGRKRRATVLPLALSEWRSEPRFGSLEGDSTHLELRQSAADARALFTPLFVDLDPRRNGRPATWRRLTVAENRAIQPRDVAAGFRVQIGGQQWVIYRSLAPVANRTVLGHNLLAEFMTGEFNADGEVEPLVLIE